MQQPVDQSIMYHDLFSDDGLTPLIILYSAASFCRTSCDFCMTLSLARKMVNGATDPVAMEAKNANHHMNSIR